MLTLTPINLKGKYKEMKMFGKIDETILEQEDIMIFVWVSFSQSLPDFQFLPFYYFLRKIPKYFS